MTADPEFSLEVIFSGVSTHFRKGIVAGIRHRAVLPDASHFFSAFISIEGYPKPFEYYLNPHYARIDAGDGVDLTVPGLIDGGDIVAGVRLQVGNGIPGGDLDADDSMFKLRTYAPRTEYSADVVTGGRAACYFDFDYGTAKWITSPTEASRFSITVETNGYPWLLVTPLDQTPGTPPFTKLDLGRQKHVLLQVNNLEAKKDESADQDEGQFDFLFHYLTARGGIPKHIVTPTPGLDNPKSATPKQIANALRRLASLQSSQPQEAAAVPVQLSRWGQTPACSPAEFG